VLVDEAVQVVVHCESVAGQAVGRGSGDLSQTGKAVGRQVRRGRGQFCRERLSFVSGGLRRQSAFLGSLFERWRLGEAGEGVVGEDRGREELSGKSVLRFGVLDSVCFWEEFVASLASLSLGLGLGRLCA